MFRSCPLHPRMAIRAHCLIHVAAFVLVIVAGALFSPRSAMAQTMSWLRAIGAGGVNWNDFGTAVCMDREGNTYVGMRFSDTLHIGSLAVTSHGRLDVFIAKIDRSGEIVWWRSAGGTGDDYVTGLSLGPDASLYVATSMQGDSVRFGDVPVSKEEASSSDPVIARYGIDGSLRWVRRFGGTGWDIAYAVAAMPDGGCMVAGSFMDSMRIGSTVLRMVGTNDAYVMRLNGDGDPLWARGFGGDTYEHALSIAVDDAGRIYTTGMFASSVLRLDTFALVNVGTVGGFLASFNPDGTTRFARTTGVGPNNYPAALAVDPTGAVYVVASYYGPIDFGELVLPEHPYLCGYVASYSRYGAFRWVRDVCGDSSTALNGIAAESSLALDGGESVFVTGGLAGRMAAGNTTLIPQRGGFDLFAAHLGDGGAIDWGVLGGGPIDDIGNAIATDGLGTCAVVGSFSYAANDRRATDAMFGPSTLSSRGADDAVVAWIGSAAGVERAAEPGSARFAVDPNPARDRAWVTVGIDHPSSVRIELIDLLGAVRHVVVEEAFTVGPHRLPVETSELAPGLYVCRVTIDGVPSGTLPVVVR